MTWFSMQKRSSSWPRPWHKGAAGAVPGRASAVPVLGLVAALLFAPGAWSQGYDEGRKAYLEGDYARAYQILMPLAEGGNSDAQKLVGVMYDYGHGVRQDISKALEWYLKAAQQGDPAVQYHVGTKYFQGHGTPQNPAEAVRWWELAASGGQVDAQFNLGLMYLRGQHVTQDDKRAAELFSAAAAQGHAHAQYSLAVMYASGRGFERDYAKALDWFRKSAEAGVPEAQYNVGVIYETGYDVVTPDPVVARTWYERAAALGLKEAQDKLAALDGGAAPGSAVAHPQEAPMAKASAQPASTRVYDPRTDGSSAAARQVAAAAPAAAAPAPPAAPVAAAAQSAAGGPHREDWVLAQNPAGYTLQIGSVTSEADIVRFIEENGIADQAAYIRVVIDGTTRYNALYGSYSDYAAAEAAVSQLPPEVQRVKPWVRNFGVLQKLIR
jgi:TPR repeat protein